MPTSPLPEEDEETTDEVIELTKPFPPTELKLNPITRQTVALPSPTERLLLTTRVEKTTEEPIFPLPDALERHIRVLKDSNTLGVQVDIEDNGVNGLLAKYVDPDGTIGRDGRIHPGDYLVKVSGQNLRNRSQQEAIEIIRQTNKIPLNNEISITYIPASDAAVFKTSAITRLAEEGKPSCLFTFD